MTQVYASWNGQPGQLPDIQKQCYSAQRHTYTPLPWALEDLPGSKWRNVHVGTEMHVLDLCKNRWGEPDLKYETGKGITDRTLSLVIWLTVRELGKVCLLEHWVRVDCFGPEFEAQFIQLERTHALQDEKKRLEADRAKHQRKVTAPKTQGSLF